MTRFVIDAPTCLALLRRDERVESRHQLVAPVALKSEVLALLYAEVRAGALTDAVGRRQLDRFAELPVRLLGDRVSRARAWALARDLGWDDPGPAEYLAVAVLQADAVVTADPRLVDGARGRVPVVSPAELLTELGGGPDAAAVAER